jgi:FkbM family methyltransferase
MSVAARALASWWVGSDRASRRNLLARSGKDPLPVRVRALGGDVVWIRPGSSDRMVVMDTFLRRLHLPPDGADVRTILDLGGNTGLTARHFAHRYPRAAILCVEMDPENAELARRNLASVRERARVIEAAAWSCSGSVSYSLAPGAEWAARIQWGGDRRALAMSLDEITRGLERIDYVKMDVEGSEAELLGAPGEWTRKVRDIKVEVHEPYSIDRCVADLRRAGFDARPFSNRYRLVVGRNRRNA